VGHVIGEVGRINKEQPFLDRYWDEIEEHGLERLTIQENEKELSAANKTKVN